MIAGTPIEISPDIKTSGTELAQELSWLSSVITTRLQIYCNIDTSLKSVYELLPPAFTDDPGHYGKFVMENKLGFAERIILITALAPHIQPSFLDETIQNVATNPGEFPEIGGTRGQNFRGFLPTAETIIFILSEPQVIRYEVQKFFLGTSFLIQSRSIEIESVKYGEPATSGRLIIPTDLIELFTLGAPVKPKLSLAFPAQLLETPLEWEDLVLNEKTREQIAELEIWIKHHHQLMVEWDMKKRLNPGFRVLFHGPPGTGKTLTAGLLGKYTGKDVFRIDLSMIVSKFIGETEKNLAALFDKAENKDWILFFDEADAIFGKRTNVKDAHDKYANQEVSYLLQRIEKHAGLVILASNFKANIDEAFTRRFNSVIYFPLPKSAERLLIWRKGLPPKARLHPSLDLSYLSRQYELSGANIMNVIQYACLQCLGKNSDMILPEDIQDGIKKELQKEGKMA